MTLSPLIIGLIIFAVLAGGAFVGWETRQRLPAHHLNEETYEVVEQVEYLMLELRPPDARRQWFLQQALLHAAKIGNAHWLLGQEAGQGTPKAFVALVVFWLSLLFASFGLFAPRNLISGLTLVLCAIAVAGAVEMILELEQPFGGVLHMSPLPMHQTV